MNSFVNNNWVVSLVSILIGFAVTPFLQRIGEWIRSRNGALTGTYLALTQTYDRSHLLAEVVQCRQIGQRLKGTITARAELSLDRNGEVETPTAITGVYHFVGRIRGRQVLLNYWSTAQGSQNSGTMTMVIGASGMAFRGLWCGTATNEKVTSNNCMWIRDENDTIRTGEIISLAQFADEELDAYLNPWRKAQGRRPVFAKLVEDGTQGAEGARKHAESIAAAFAAADPPLD